jgi:methionine aminopeptidase
VAQICLPTAVSVNNVFGHYSPQPSDKKATLSDGDVVKVELGAHIDGFVGVVGHSTLVGAMNTDEVGSTIAFYIILPTIITIMIVF